MTLLRRLLPYCQAARLATVGGALLLVLTAGLELLQPWPIKWLVDYILGGTAPPPHLARLLPG
ncbi:ABC transporter ATP-binding protein, partial [bacterium]|nr:ABC transporter ATP-binding protein [bacterium]